MYSQIDIQIHTQSKSNNRDYDSINDLITETVPLIKIQRPRKHVSFELKHRRIRDNYC